MLFQPLKPMLLTMHKEAFSDEKWLHEPKWDGVRVLIHKQGDRIEAFTRHGNQVTSQFPELAEVASGIKTHTAIIDTEVICMRDGRPVFDDINQRIRLHNVHKIKRAVTTNPATFIAFDLLATDKEHINEMLTERKERLNEIIEPNSAILPTAYTVGDGLPLKKYTEEQNWEGIVSKLVTSRYRLDHRSTEWLKVKNFKLADTVILGYRRKPHFALIVGMNFPTVSNKAVATVEFGFRPEDKIAFLRVVEQLHTQKVKDVQWVEPRLCCRIQYLDRSDNHTLRITSFKGFLFDKQPDDCRWVS